MAAEVVLLMKSVLAPVLDRLAAAEARLVDAEKGSARIEGYTSFLQRDAAALSERVAVVETKAAQHDAPMLDIVPILTRIAAAEVRLETLGDVRDRVVAVETKAALPAPEPTIVDLSPVQARLAAIEIELSVVADLVKDNDVLCARIAAVETKAERQTPEPATVDLAPVLMRLDAVEERPFVTKELWAAMSENAVHVRDTLGALRDRLAVVEVKADMPTMADPAIEHRVIAIETKADTALGDLRERLATIERRIDGDLLGQAALRERIAVIEERPSVPGPVGEQGPPGRDAVDGKNGAPGLSFEGVYQEGKSYELGHLVTWAGSSWHCNEPTTTKPGDGSKAWTLMVKRGRDGRDGVDAPGVPVVSVGKVR